MVDTRPIYSKVAIVCKMIDTRPVCSILDIICKTIDTRSIYSKEVIVCKMIIVRPICTRVAIEGTYRRVRTMVSCKSRKQWELCGFCRGSRVCFHGKRAGQAEQSNQKL